MIPEWKNSRLPSYKEKFCAYAVIMDDQTSCNPCFFLSSSSQSVANSIARKTKKTAEEIFLYSISFLKEVVS